MALSGKDVVVVTDGHIRVGILTRSDLWPAGRRLAGDVRVDQVLTWELVRVRPDDDAPRTLRRYRDAAWRSVLRRHPARKENR
jgi:hypothetical protein